MKTLHHIALVVAMLFAFTAAGASGPQPGDVDPSFNMGSGINGLVTMTILQTNGQIIIGGTFTTVNGAVRPGLARLQADGTTDFGFMNSFSGIQSGLGAFGISSIALQSDGKLIIGGNFIGVNGISRTNLARLNPDGTLDTSFRNGMAGPDGEVDVIIVQPDGKVLIGGRFGLVNGATNLFMARLNSNGSLDAGFHPLVGNINDIKLQSNGKILVSQLYDKIIRLNTDGMLDNTFHYVPINYDSFHEDSSLDHIEIGSDGKIFIGGRFPFSLSDIAGILRLNENGSLDSTFNHTNLFGRLGAVQPDGKLVTIGNCARYNTDGSKDASFNSALAIHDGFDSGVNVLSLLPDGKIIISGETMLFTNGIFRYGVARLNSDGSLDAGFQNQPGGVTLQFAVQNIYLLGVQPDGKALISGDFDYVDGIARNGLARLNADGSLDSGFQNGMAGVQRYPNVNSGLESGRVGAALVQADGKILIGGRFDSVNGVSHTNLARLNPDGSLDTTFNSTINGLIDPYNGETGQVDAIGLQPDGKILISGLFNHVNGTTRNCIARLNASGTLDTTFQGGMQGTYNSVGQYLEEVTAVAAQSDGKVLIAGGFDVINGVGRNNLARLNANGSLDAVFQPVFESLYGPQYLSPLMILQPDGKVLVGGGFQAANGLARTNLARLNSDGSLDLSFTNGIASANQVTAIALQPDGKILVGSYARTNISRLNSDGSLDASFQCGLQAASPYTGYSVYATAKAIMVQTNGSVLIGGLFDTVSGVLRPRIARIFGSIPQPSLTSVGIAANQCGFNISGYANQIAVIEGSTNLLNWIPLQTNMLSLTPVSFSDPNWTNFPKRFYRARLQ